jgi:hypothetical protein
MTTTWQWRGSLLKLGISLLFFVAYSYATGIPLPDQNMVQGKNKGLNAGMGLGVVRHTECKTLWTWTSQAYYSYDSLWAGGASINFLGGNLDSTNNLVYQRYSASGRIMLANEPKHAVFIGPVISFENTDLQSLRKIGGDRKTETECSDFFATIGSSIGYHSGLGFLATPDLGFAFGHDFDITLKGAIMASFTFSIAFNLREQFEKLKENTKNLWLSLEYSVHSSMKQNSANYFILGFAIGF